MKIIFVADDVDNISPLSLEINKREPKLLLRIKYAKDYVRRERMPNSEEKKEESNLIERCSFKGKNFIYKTSKKKA